MKNLFCKKLAASLCMKQPLSPSPEPPLKRRNKPKVITGDQFNMDPLSSQTENESVKTLLKRLCDLKEARIYDRDEQRYEDEKENEMKNDWMLAAAVLDRICAIAFTIIFVVGTVIFNVSFAVHL